MKPKYDPYETDHLMAEIEDRVRERFAREAAEKRQRELDALSRKARQFHDIAEKHKKNQGQ